MQREAEAGQLNEAMDEGLREFRRDIHNEILGSAVG